MDIVERVFGEIWRTARTGAALGPMDQHGVVEAGLWQLIIPLELIWHLMDTSVDFWVKLWIQNSQIMVNIELLIIQSYQLIQQYQYHSMVQGYQKCGQATVYWKK